MCTTRKQIKNCAVRVELSSYSSWQGKNFYKTSCTRKCTGNVIARTPYAYRTRIGLRPILTVSCVLYVEEFTYSIWKIIWTSQYEILYLTLSEFVQKNFVHRRPPLSVQNQSLSTEENILWVYRRDFWGAGVFFKNYLEGSSDTWDVYVLSIRNTLGDS